MGKLRPDEIRYLKSLPDSDFRIWLNDIAGQDKATAAAILREIEESGWTTDDRQAVARFFDIAPETVNLWIKKGMPYESQGKGARGVYDLRECARWLASQRSIGSETDERQLSVEIRYREEKLKLAELERKQKEGRLVDVEVHNAAVLEITGMIRKGIESFHRAFGNEAAEFLAGIINEAESQWNEANDSQDSQD